MVSRSRPIRRNCTSSTRVPHMAAAPTSVPSTLMWAAGKVTNDKVFAENFAPGFSDGVRTDIDGNVWCSMGWAEPSEDGVRCYAPNGDMIGKIHIPETCANLCFGGPKRNRLFICGSTSVYSVYVETQGALLP